MEATDRSTVDSKLTALANGSLDPGDAADWAMTALRDMDDDEDVDDAVMEALDKLSGADLLSGPGTYLHGPADFRTWLSEFRAAAS
ncbi:hypothetical protein LEP48_18010 [Isoptericola sp. NEAU-Y5]|uniref:Uncharacterized protein n=1 Tax=Isoptericola luteus TaxID=2879484 RepID=A0ABS7ZK16_9MICO|nr:hypothetical protein [Isoptericola sp. NEAU-Y5]MCA5895228.1 hypothetical protein [Isoptericola sp. NEAU-Y5]